MLLVWAPVIAIVVSVVASAIAVVTDFRTGHIPNWLPLSAAIAGVVLQVLGDTSPGRGLLSALAGMAVCGLFPAILWIKGGMMGGDLKLLVGLGALLGAYHGIEAEFLAACVGALFSLAMLAWQGKLLAVLGNSFFLAFNLVLPRKWRRELHPSLMHKVRFALAIFLGATLSAVARFRL